MKKTVLIVLFFFAPLLIFSQNNPPTAVTDYVNTFQGHAIADILANDYDVDGDSMRILTIASYPAHGSAWKISKTSIEYYTDPGYCGIDSLRYILIDYGTPHESCYGKVIFNVDNQNIFDSVAINNICAGVYADGLLFTQEEYNGTSCCPKFEVPKGSGANTIFCGSIWIGGLDIMDSIHVAAQRYYSITDCDFWAGPVANVYDSIYDNKYKRLWKIDKADIDYHISHWQEPNYQPSPRLLNWPGNGNVQNGESSVLAPFNDNNDDNIYDPYAGDYPLIRGDEAVLFIFNDDRKPHTESGGKKLGVEILGMLYAFDCQDDSSLWNTVFLNLKFTNRSANTYYKTYIANHTDFNLGNMTDDYLGSDVQRGSYYCYNGKNIDGNGNPGSYGAFPPAQSVTFLGGPNMDPDGLDNPAGGCDESINGLNFGNSIIDDERHGLSKSGPYYCFAYCVESCPSDANEFYNYMHGYWFDGLQMHYWGNGHPNQSGTGPACSFMFPGSSDPCNWGTGGINPGDTALWTEEQSGNLPYDRRSYGSSGPFTFHPGASQELDLAYVFGRNFTDSNAKAAIPVMQQRIDSVRSYFIKNSTPCGSTFKSYNPDISNQNFFYIYPNPASESISVEYSPNVYSRFEVFDAMGRLLKSGELKETRKHILDISGFRKGIYFLRAIGENSKTTKKFIKN